MRKLMPFAVLAVFILGTALACNGNGPVTLPNGGADLRDSGTEESNHQLFGMWSLEFDGNDLKVTDITYRALGAHLNVKKFLKPPACDTCLKYSNVHNDTVNGILSADLTVTNPTSWQAADLRGIVISSKPDVYLLNPDDYTTLFDTHTPPQKNPFRLFGKTNPNGIINPFGEVTEHFELYYGSVPLKIDTAFDVVYPANAKREPYAISDQAVSGNLDVNGKIPRLVTCDVYDRHNDQGQVSITCPELSISEAMIQDLSNKKHYSVYIQNSSSQPAGEYTAWISAADSDPTVKQILYDKIILTVSESLGAWSITQYDIDTGCAPDIGFGYDMVANKSLFIYPGGAGCDRIYRAETGFTNEKSFFNLNNIDPLVSGFSPFPIKRIDSGFAGGIAFFADSDEIYEDSFYTGPVSSLLITLYPDVTGKMKYINPGDGDAGRINSSNSILKGVDVCDGLNGDMYGLWADPDSVFAPEIYGVMPDYTRHDVIMGGKIPDVLLGSGAGKISRNPSNLRGIDVMSLGLDNGMIYFLESTGTSSEIEVFQFYSDFLQKTTTFSSLATIPIGSVDAVDLELMISNINYLPNPDSDTIAVFIKGSSGGYLKMYATDTNDLAEGIGSSIEPVLSGTAAFLDFDNLDWKLAITNHEGQATVLKWVL
ncbi:MAG: hypothetical protein ABIC40_08890 [bacterium]